MVAAPAAGTRPQCRTFADCPCARCGGTVPTSLRATPYVWIPYGAIDGAIAPEVVAHFYVTDRAPRHAGPWSAVAAMAGHRCRRPASPPC